MTQIQEIENLSQPELVKLVHTERQQHADDMDMLSKELASRAAPIELRVVADILAEGSGSWATCSGCHESNDGAPTGPYSQVMQCTLGVGCSECGGIGAIWDTTDYDEMADAMFGTICEETPNAPMETLKTGGLQTFLSEAKRAGITHLNPKRACGNPQCSWEGYTDRLCGSVGPLCPECGETTEPICSCPSGDGSLRWPCPVHLPESEREVQP